MVNVLILFEGNLKRWTSKKKKKKAYKVGAKEKYLFWLTINDKEGHLFAIQRGGEKHQKSKWKTAVPNTSGLRTAASTRTARGAPGAASAAAPTPAFPADSNVKKFSQIKK